jgi:hypothetical protein
MSLTGHSARFLQLIQMYGSQALQKTAQRAMGLHHCERCSSRFQVHERKHIREVTAQLLAVCSKCVVELDAQTPKNGE